MSDVSAAPELPPGPPPELTLPPVPAPALEVVRPPRAPAARQFDLRASLRWFGPQLLVVVSGILIALALDAWWDAREDGRRERAYLRQLDADLMETETIVAGYDRFLQPVDSTAALLVRAYRTPTPPVPDSVYAWFIVGARFGVPRPVLGTAEALVTTGDLRLLRNDSLRTEIVAYLEYNRALLASQDAVGEVWRQGFFLVNSRTDFTDILLQGEASDRNVDSLAQADRFYEVPAGPRIRPFPVTTAALLQDREVYEGLWTMNSAKRSLAAIRAEMRGRARGLRSLVGAALEE